MGSQPQYLSTLFISSAGAKRRAYPVGEEIRIVGNERECLGEQEEGGDVLELIRKCVG